MQSFACLAGAILIVGIVFFANAIRIVPEYQRLVVFRLGRVLDVPRGPGFVLLLPTIDRAVKVDLREQVREVSNNVLITKDNIPLAVDFLWYYKVIDPVRSIVSISNFEVSATAMAITILRSIIGDIMLDEVLSRRENINVDLREKLDEVGKQYGVRVTNIEIRKIVPPREAQEVMKDRLMSESVQRTVGTLGETQTTVHVTGMVLVGGHSFDAMSGRPIAPSTKVRVKRVVLEVEEDTST